MIILLTVPCTMSGGTLHIQPTLLNIMTWFSFSGETNNPWRSVEPRFRNTRTPRRLRALQQRESIRADDGGVSPFGQHRRGRRGSSGGGRLRGGCGRTCRAAVCAPSRLDHQSAEAQGCALR